MEEADEGVSEEEERRRVEKANRWAQLQRDAGCATPSHVAPRAVPLCCAAALWRHTEPTCLDCIVPEP